MRFVRIQENMQVSLRTAHKHAAARVVSSGTWVLVAALLAEVATFAAIGENFLTVGNVFEVLRFSIELGLLAVAMRGSGTRTRVF